MTTDDKLKNLRERVAKRAETFRRKAKNLRNRYLGLKSSSASMARARLLAKATVYEEEADLLDALIVE